jgi:nucleoside-diphosphate-sugar epimerase
MRDASGRAIAVLGADGYIGSHVTSLALAAGARVIGFCVKDPWRLSGVDHARLKLEPVGPTWWLDEAARSVTNALRRVDALVVLAYRPPTSSSFQSCLEEELRVNASTVARLAQSAAAVGVPLVFASSADVYGPWHENPVAEEVVARPASPYAIAKLEAEQRIEQAYGRPCDYMCLRIATVYGPGENGPRAIPSFVRAFAQGKAAVVHGDGRDVRDYVHVRDVAAAILNAAVGPRGDHGIANVGSGIGRTTLQVLQGVAAAMNVEPVARHEARSNPPSRLVLDAARARQALDFVARTDFTDALREEARWLRQRLNGQLTATQPAAECIR